MVTGAGSAAFQPADGLREEYAEHEGLRSVLDPADALGTKNAHIDALHKLAVEHALGRERDLRVVDFGCGTGRLCRHLASRTRSVVGVDLTPAMLKRAAGETVAGNVRYLRTDGTHLPLADATADRIVCAYVLQYVVRERNLYRAILREMHRVLAPGGRIALIEQVSFSAGRSRSLRRGTRPSDYLDWDDDTPFAVVESAPVRPGRPLAFERRTVLRSRFPAPLRPAVNRLVFRRNRRLSSEALAEQPYVDWLFALAKMG
jgi:SAM-dependent methyltransferase